MDGVIDDVADGVAKAVVDGVIDNVADGVANVVADGDSDAPADGEADGVTDHEGDGDTDALADGEEDAGAGAGAGFDASLLLDGVGVGDLVGLGLLDGVLAGVLEGVGEGELLDVGVGEDVVVGDGDEVELGEGVGVTQIFAIVRFIFLRLPIPNQPSIDSAIFSRSFSMFSTRFPSVQGILGKDLASVSSKSGTTVIFFDPETTIGVDWEEKFEHLMVLKVFPECMEPDPTNVQVPPICVDAELIISSLHVASQSP